MDHVIRFRHQPDRPRQVSPMIDFRKRNEFDEEIRNKNEEASIKIMNKSINKEILNL